MKYPKHLLAASMVVLSICARADNFSVGGITVANPHARPTVEGQANAGAFMTLSNQGVPDRLLGVTTPAAASAELHEMRMDGSVMRMRAMGPLELPTGQTVELRPGAYHVMLLGLTAPLQPGQHLPMTLRFEKAGKLDIDVVIEASGVAR